MKLDLKKVIIPTLAIAIGAAIVGSVSGTVAWYQYSTRASTAYLGTSLGASGNLQLRIQGEEKWVADLTYDQVQTWLKNHKKGQNVQPVTAGGLDKDGALPANFYKNPVAGRAAYDNWIAADEQNYVTIPLEFRYIERDGKAKTINNEKVDEECVAKDVYLSDLLIQPDWENTKDNDDGSKNDRLDLSDAIRVHIHSYHLDDNNNVVDEVNRLISNHGGTTVAYGKLDIDGDGDPDKAWNGTGSGAEYGFGQGNQQVEIVYGEENSVQTSYSNKEDILDVEENETKYYDANNEKQNEVNNILPSVVHYNPNTLELSKLTYKDGDSVRQSKKIGTTIAFDPTDEEAEKYLQVDITIWVEGWQKFGVLNPDYQGAEDQEHDQYLYSSIWDGGYIDSKFDIGFSFGCQAAEYASHNEDKESEQDNANDANDNNDVNDNNDANNG